MLPKIASDGYFALLHRASMGSFMGLHGLAGTVERGFLKRLGYSDRTRMPDTVMFDAREIDIHTKSGSGGYNDLTIFYRESLA